MLLHHSVPDYQTELSEKKKQTGTNMWMLNKHLHINEDGQQV